MTRWREGEAGSTEGQADGEDTEPDKHLNKTPTDSKPGEGSTTAGIHDAGASHRHRPPTRGVPPHPQGRGGGVDGRTGAEYAKNLEANLQALLDRVKSRKYRAPPVRRVHIPKGSGSKTRPIGVPTFADKILQRAVVMILEPIYEQDFVPWSYGFRPGRSAHQALADMWEALTQMYGGWVLEVDIQSFFDELDHDHLRGFLRHRVRDGALLRLLAVQHQTLTAKLRGHDAYYGITGNAPMLSWLRRKVRYVWRFWLNRRSQRAKMTWEKFYRLLERYPLPEPKVVHTIYR